MDWKSVLAIGLLLFKPIKSGIEAYRTDKMVNDNYSNSLFQYNLDKTTLDRFSNAPWESVQRYLDTLDEEKAQIALKYILAKSESNNRLNEFKDEMKHMQKTCQRIKKN